MSSMTDANTIGRFIDRASALYSLPAIAAEVMQLTNHPQVDAKALKNCIENDPALTTKILGVVNSSLFGLSSEVSDLNQALALLGTKPLKLLVLGFSLPEKLFVGIAGEMLGHYWRRTLTKAIAARELCDAHWKAGGDEAFIAGLLADVGVLALLKDLGAPYVRFLDKVVEENGDLLALEREALGFDHAMLSAGLLRKWGLPQSLTEAIATPKILDVLRRATGPAARLPQVLHLAELLAQLVSERRIGALPDLLEAAKIYRGITRTQITALVEQLDERVAQLADVLSLELPNQQAFSELVCEAHARLAEVAADAAIQLARSSASDTSVLEHMLAETRALSAAASSVAAAPLPVPPSATEPPNQKLTETSTPHSRRAGVRDGSPPMAKPSSGQATATAEAPPEASLALAAQLTAAIGMARQARCELTVLVAEADHLDQVMAAYGSDAAKRIHVILETMAKVLDHPTKVIARWGETRQVLALVGCDRRQAVELAAEFVRTFRQFAERQFSGGALPVLISVGAATVTAPRKSLQPHELLQAADRCLYGAHAGGGNTVKSIEIY